MHRDQRRRRGPATPLRLQRTIASSEEMQPVRLTLQSAHSP